LLARWTLVLHEQVQSSPRGVRAFSHNIIREPIFAHPVSIHAHHIFIHAHPISLHKHPSKLGLVTDTSVD